LVSTQANAQVISKDIYEEQDYLIEKLLVEEKEDQTVVYARAYSETNQLSFGKNVDIEKFIIHNPPTLVPDPTGEIKRYLVTPDGKVKTFSYRYDPTEALNITLQEAVKEVSTGNTPISGKIGQTTHVFYASSSARVSRLATDVTWSSARDSSNAIDVNFTDAGYYLAAEYRSTGKYEVTRMLNVFPTFNITSSNQVDSAIFSLNFCGDNFGTDPIGIEISTTTHNGDFDATDFSKMVINSPFELASRTSSFASANNYDNWTFSTSARATINTSTTTVIAVRMAKDIDNTTPTTRNYRCYYSSNLGGTTQDPKLTITTSPVVYVNSVPIVISDNISSMLSSVNCQASASQTTCTYAYSSTTPYNKYSEGAMFFMGLLLLSVGIYLWYKITRPLRP